MPKYTIITGATSGIGFETAKKLLLAGHYLILGNRNQEKAKNIKQQLLDLKPDGNIDLLEIDLSSFQSIEAFSKVVISKYDRIDNLINNAGLFSREKRFNENGIELTHMVNHLGTYYLTELLLNKLQDNPISKIIMVSSIGCYWNNIRLEDKMFYQSKSSFRNYFNSKLANLAYAKQLSIRYPKQYIKAADPGVAYSKIWKWKTKFGRSLDNLYKKLVSTSEKGSRIVFDLVENSNYIDNSNLLFSLKKARKLPKKARNEEFRIKLIEYTKQTIEKVK